MTRILPVSAGLALCAFALAAQAEEPFSVDAELDLGAEYDSTLTVEELDRSTDTSDTALLMRGKLDGKWTPSDKLTLSGGYSLLSRDYRDHSEFDLDIHQVYGDLSYDFKPVTVGVSHYYALARLDNDNLLDMNQTSLYASRLFDQRFFVRLAANFREKAFDNRSDRDADSTGLSGDVYWFFNGASTYVTAGLSGEDEDAVGPEFDYDSREIKTGVSHKFPVAEKPTQLSLDYRYEDREYDSPDPRIGAPRGDTRQSTELEWEVSFNPHLAVVSSLKYRDYNSNLTSIDYSETLASLAVRLKL